VARYARGVRDVGADRDPAHRDRTGKDLVTGLADLGDEVLAGLVAPLLLLAAFSSARAGIMGVVAIVLTIAFVADPASFSPQYKSDMRDVAGELAPYLRPGDLVVVAEPEQSRWRGTTYRAACASPPPSVR